jgi:hypothetical protein
MSSTGELGARRVSADQAAALIRPGDHALSITTSAGVHELEMLFARETD